MKNKFTFKKQPVETGLRSIGYSNPNTDVKFNKHIIGEIVAPCWSSNDHKWFIRFMVRREPTEQWSAEFCWKTIKKRFDTEPEARQYILENSDKLEKEDLHWFEDE
jgi:hypothetical protein